MSGPRRRVNETEKQYNDRKKAYDILNDPKYSHRFNDNCTCNECSERFRRIFFLEDEA